jgi:hypothetical protein
MEGSVWKREQQEEKMKIHLFQKCYFYSIHSRGNQIYIIVLYEVRSSSQLLARAKIQIAEAHVYIRIMKGLVIIDMYIELVISWSSLNTGVKRVCFPRRSIIKMEHRILTIDYIFATITTYLGFVGHVPSRSPFQDPRDSSLY